MLLLLLNSSSSTPPDPALGAFVDPYRMWMGWWSGNAVQPVEFVNGIRVIVPAPVLFVQVPSPPLVVQFPAPSVYESPY